MSTIHSLYRSRASLLGVGIGLSALGMAATVPQANDIALDTAANYTNGTTTTTPSTGSNPGYGFGAWTVTGTGKGFAGLYNDGPGTQSASVSSIATAGNQWNVFANGGKVGSAPPRVDLYRPFNNPLAVGQTFSVAMDSGGVGTGVSPSGKFLHLGLPAIGFTLQSANPRALALGSSVMTLGSHKYQAQSYANPKAVFTFSLTDMAPGETLNGQTNSTGNYQLETNITDGTGTHSSLTGLTDSQLEAGVTASFSLDAKGAYKLTLNSFGANPTQLVPPITGTIRGTINGVDLFDQATASDGDFNVLAITATPALASTAAGQSSTQVSTANIGNHSGLSTAREINSGLDVAKVKKP
jgi:hypothetical protein